MTIYIKNMVCNRCIMVVTSTLEKLGLQPVRVILGEVELQEHDISSVKTRLTQKLQSLGFDLLDDKKSQTIERVKNLIVDLVQNKGSEIQVVLSDYLAEELRQDYSTISKLFSELEGLTIEKYFILQKVEKVKELLVYDELTVSEIAVQLNYSSAAHLSNQFKKVTGLTPSYFKKFRTVERKSLEEL